MRERLRKPDMGGLLALLLLGVFGVCVLSVLLTGAGAYRGLAERDREAYSWRTAAQYLTTKVRQSDQWNGVTVEDFGGRDALALTEEIDGEVYVTRVYCDDGYIRELFAAADAEMAPKDGEKIIEAYDLKLSPGPTDHEIVAEITDASRETTRLLLTLRSGKGGLE